MTRSETKQLRRAIAVVALANLAYFGVEYRVAQQIGSVSLFADSIDFLEDASLNLLILCALGWTATRRAALGMGLALLLLVPGIATLWAAWEKFHALVPPAPFLLSATGTGALVVNLACAFLLARYRHHQGSLTKAAFLSARNDAYANLAIMATGLITHFTASGWPDLLVGAGIAAMNADAAHEIWTAARSEHREAQA